MISRIWRGWTSKDNANAYDVLLRTEIFPGILGRNIIGLRRIELFRAPADVCETMPLVPCVLCQTPPRPQP